MRQSGNLYIIVGLCLLTLGGLLARATATPTMAISDKEAAISSGESISEKTVSAASLMEDLLTVPRHNLEVEEEAAPAATSEEIVESPPPQATRLLIPALGVDAPIVEVPITDETWNVSGLTQEIAHLGGTANPGERDNLVLAGHVTLQRGAGPFLHLESLEPGEVAIVYAGEEAYAYRVVSKRYVEPTDVSIAGRTSEPILTLITCTNWDARNRNYNERVVVIAELVEEGTPRAR